LDSFKKIKEICDKMIVHLQTEQKQEFADNEKCVSDIRDTENDEVDNKNALEDSNANVKEMKEQIAQFDAELKVLAEDISNQRVSIKEAGENRRDENKNFQNNVNTQRATVAILNRVLKKLQAFYARKGTFLQTKQEPVENKPGQANTKEPDNFKTFKTQENANGVMVMIQSIIKDAQAEDQKAVAGERDSQGAYAKFVTESNAAVTQDLKETADKKSQKADTEGKLADEDAKNFDLKNEKMEIAKTLSDHHAACDFLLKNFDVRQASRDQEISDIQQAKAILSGAKFD